MTKLGGKTKLQSIPAGFNIQTPSLAAVSRRKVQSATGLRYGLCSQKGIMIQQFSLLLFSVKLCFVFWENSYWWDVQFWMKIASKSKHQLVKREAISYSLEQVQTGFRILVRYHIWRTGIDFRCDLLRMSLNLHHRSTQVNLLRRQSSLPNRPTRQSSYGGTEARYGHQHLSCGL